MRILAVDTATDICGVALWEDDHIAAEICMDQGATHTQVLMEAVRAVLEKAGLHADALDGFAVTQGPGSFTGLRIGISTVKGLALATGKPLVGISTLAVLAHQAPGHTVQVCPMIDARRGEVYWSVYRRIAADLVPTGPEAVGSVADVRLDGQQVCLFIGNGARLYAPTLKQLWPHAVYPEKLQQHALSPGVLAHLGAQRLRRGAKEDLHQFAPVYLRKSDAELAAAKRPSS